MISSTYYPKWAGFESLPKGKLLSHFVDFDSDFGFARERCVHFEKNFHFHDRLNLSFPLGSTLVEIQAKGSNTSYKIGKNEFLWIPPQVVHSHKSVTTIYDTFALVDELVVGATKSLEVQQISHLKSNVISGKRSPFLDELLTRYLWFCSEKQHRTEEAISLGKYILSEVVEILTHSRRNFNFVSQLDMASSQTDEIALLKAVQYIELNLFEDIRIEQICRVSRVSQATLFRYFEKELKLTPQDLR